MPTFPTKNPMTSISKSPIPINKQMGMLQKQMSALANSMKTADKSLKDKAFVIAGTPTSYGNSVTTFDQGQDPDCVAASTVMTRLAADPVLTLGVTTGQGPAAVGGAKGIR
jgi:hypothetical protein